MKKAVKKIVCALSILCVLFSAFVIPTFAAISGDNASWAHIPDYGGKDWYTTQYYNRYSEELPVSVYAVDLRKSIDSSVSLTWAKQVRVSHDY